MKYIIARKVGGSRGNSSMGQNFGKCTAEDKKYTDKNGVEWNQERVLGSLLVWGWEYTLANSFEEAQQVLLKNINCVVSFEFSIDEIRKCVGRRGLQGKIVGLDPENKSLLKTTKIEDYFNFGVGFDKRIIIKKS